VGQCRWCFQITAEAAAHTFSASPEVDQFKVYVSLEEKKLCYSMTMAATTFTTGALVTKLYS